MPLGSPLTKAHIVRLWEERTLMPFPLIDALGMSNIYKNVMAWQPAIKLVITEPVQKPDRKEEMLGVMSAWRTRRGGTEACKQLFSDCLRLGEISKRVLVMLWKNNVVELVGTQEVWWVIGASHIWGLSPQHRIYSTHWNMSSLIKENKQTLLRSFILYLSSALHLILKVSSTQQQYLYFTYLYVFRDLFGPTSCVK